MQPEKPFNLRIFSGIHHVKCGKPSCRCHQDPKYLHGPCYRWTGWINGKPTTKTISEEIACECQKRIENYKELQKKIDKTVANALDQALGRKSRKMKDSNQGLTS